ncbi:ArsR family transcriptional regulator [Amycolatopsis sp. NPDC049868]|uniref:ArsR family transcriptional regulator n=1 Tax=Amycolatopsis sp. NPDC049868 TaxID=3363934 RepID=UPI0037B13694
MLTLRMNTSGMGRVKLALSPASEVLVWLWLLTTGRRHPTFGFPGPVARSALGHPDVALVAGALSPVYAPDMLTPAATPGRSAAVLDHQLSLVSGTAMETVAEQIGHVAVCGGTLSSEVRGSIDAGTFGARAASGLWVFWRQVLADDWRGLETTMEADLARRRHTMADLGLGELLGSLHPRVLWTGRSLAIDLGAHDEEVELGTRELVLSPSILNWPNVTAQICGEQSAAINYPAFGQATRDGHTPKSLARLYGATRASLLADLESERSTAELSARHELSPSTVSYHLKVLYQARLITRRREGHLVLYQRRTSSP